MVPRQVRNGPDKQYCAAYFEVGAVVAYDAFEDLGVHKRAVEECSIRSIGVH